MKGTALDQASSDLYAATAEKFKALAQPYLGLAPQYQEETIDILAYSFYSGMLGAKVMLGTQLETGDATIDQLMEATKLLMKPMIKMMLVAYQEIADAGAFTGANAARAQQVLTEMQAAYTDYFGED